MASGAASPALLLAQPRVGVLQLRHAARRAADLRRNLEPRHRPRPPRRQRRRRCSCRASSPSRSSSSPTATLPRRIALQRADGVLKRLRATPLTRCCTSAGSSSASLQPHSSSRRRPSRSAAPRSGPFHGRRHPAAAHHARPRHRMLRRAGPRHQRRHPHRRRRRRHHQWHLPAPCHGVGHVLRHPAPAPGRSTSSSAPSPSRRSPTASAPHTTLPPTASPSAAPSSSAPGPSPASPSHAGTSGGRRDPARGGRPSLSYPPPIVIGTGPAGALPPPNPEQWKKALWLCTSSSGGASRPVTSRAVDARHEHVAGYRIGRLRSWLKR